MLPDSSERTARIPVCWVDGRWQLEDGGNLPAISPHAQAEIVIPAVCLTDEQQRARWSIERRIRLLQQGRRVLARVTEARIPPELHKRTLPAPRQATASRLVEIVLEQDLYLTVVRGKKGRLLDCKCRIPALGEEAASLNEAYKKIATRFEPGRRSAAGNVFSLVWLANDDGSYQCLNDLREQATYASSLAAEDQPPSARTHAMQPLLPGMGEQRARGDRGIE